MSESALEKSDALSLFSSPDAAKLFLKMVQILAQFRRKHSRSGARSLQILFHGWCMAPGDGGGCRGRKGVQGVCFGMCQNAGTNDENKMEGNIVFQNNSLIFRI